MDSVYDTLYTVIANSPSPLGIKTLAKRTGIQRKRVKAIMREQVNSGKVVRIHPSKVGSHKTQLSIFCTSDNKIYC